VSLSKGSENSGAGHVDETLVRNLASAHPSGWLYRAVSPHIDQAVATWQGWLHEIKQDGLRVIARQNGNRVRRFVHGLWYYYRGDD
jgi:hypothetical protein